MKPIVLLIVAVFLLLLLLPLPALGILEPDKPANVPTVVGPNVSSTSPPATTATTGPAAGTQTTGSGQDYKVFRIKDVASNTVITMNERDFLIGTLAAEMYPTFHIEALKAQAVAAYTYYSYQRTATRSKGNNPEVADFEDVPSTFPKLYTKEGMQEKWGSKFDAYYQKLCEAVDAVIGKKILYEGQPIKAVYHAISFETTERAEVVWGVDYPYLQSVPAAGDKLAPSYQTVVTFTPDQLQQKVAEKLKITLSGDPAGWFGKEITRSPAGTVTAITLGDKTLTGRELREALELRSANFTVTYTQASGFTFTVIGYGHGVGMSQYGADYLARQGATWEEILKYYYTGVTIN